MKYKNRVKDTSASTGLVDFALDSATETGFRNISQAYTVDDYLPYAAVDTAGNWEVGAGKYVAGPTLERIFIFESTNANSFVNFAAGGVEILVTPYGQNHELFGYTVNLSFAQSLSNGSYDSINWDTVLNDPLGIITPALPTANLVVPDWVDLIQATIITHWSLSGQTESDNTLTEIRDIANVEFLPLLRIRDSCGTGLSGVFTSLVTNPFYPQTANGRGIRVVCQHNANSGSVSTNTSCYVKFVQ